jgi:hypothetical protein
VVVFDTEEEARKMAQQLHVGQPPFPDAPAPRLRTRRATRPYPSRYERRRFTNSPTALHKRARRNDDGPFARRSTPLDSSNARSATCCPEVHLVHDVQAEYEPDGNSEEHHEQGEQQVVA